MNFLSSLAKHLSLVSRRGKTRSLAESTFSCEPASVGCRDWSAFYYRHYGRISPLGPARRGYCALPPANDDSWCCRGGADGAIGPGDRDRHATNASNDP